MDKSMRSITFLLLYISAQALLYKIFLRRDIFMKKLVSLLIALAMLLSVAAFAEPAADTTEAEGSSAVYATSTFGQ